MAKKKASAAAPPPVDAVNGDGTADAASPPSSVVNGDDEAADEHLTRTIAKLLDECRLSQAVHNRKLRDLTSLLSSSSSTLFPSSFLRALSPLFLLSRRSAPSDRVARLVSAFAASASTPPAFLDRFLRFLLLASHSAHKPARFRSCQIISDIIMRLPDDADVTGEVWDEVIECMRRRAEDKVPAIRALAVRALSRFSADAGNADIVDHLLQILPEESNIDVRKMLILSVPPTSKTAVAVIDRTLDVSETVRKAAFCALAAKFPLQSLSIKQRTITLERGLADRSSSVRTECLKMLREEWLGKCCSGDPIVLLKLLDVETYESVGTTVMKALLEDGAVRLAEGQSLREMMVASPGNSMSDIKLIEPECALYWRMMCKHLQMEAESRGSDAATTMGAEAAFFASQASISNDLLEDVLPATISDYVTLIKGHLSAGSNYRFVTRQLLLLGAMLDFSDLTHKKVASILVHELLHSPPEHEIDDEGNEIIIGDGINLGGDREWAKAVSELAKKVHAASGEFEELLAAVIEELACPCRERIANPLQWLHCLAVTGLLLENIESFWCLKGKAIEPAEVLHSLLLSGAKHIHIEVQRAAIRCLCLFGLLEEKPSEDLVKQMRLSFINGPSPVSIMACKALIDLATWHGVPELDNAIKAENSQLNDQTSFSTVDLNLKEDTNAALLDLLYAGFNSEWIQDSESDDQETIQGVLGEGFAKLLLLSENHPTIATTLHPLVLAKLICLYFTADIKELDSLKQCLSVFFEHYPALSNTHKRCLSKAFIPVMRSMWPSIYGNAGGSSYYISRMRKRAVQATHFMLQMMQTPLITTESQEEKNNDETSGLSSIEEQPSSDINYGEEGLAIRIAAEVVNFPEKKSTHGRSYVSALCRTVVLLNFRSSQQDAVKCMRILINCMIESITDKDSVKELSWMLSRLRSLDEDPEKEPSKEIIREIFEKLEVEIEVDNLSVTPPMAMPPTPAVPRSTRATAASAGPRVTRVAATPRSARVATAKRRTRHEDSSSSEDEDSSMICVPASAVTPSVRSQRASKTAAMGKMSTKTAIVLCEEGEEEDSEDASEADSGESSDESFE